MWIKYIIITLLFFIFSIVQNSFLPYFNILGAIPNIVFSLFFILIFFEQKGEYYEGFFVSIVAGFFLDIFLPFHFGISIISLLLVYFFKKLAIYFLKEAKGNYPIFYFIPIFSLSFILYNVMLYLFSIFFRFNFILGYPISISLAYSLVFAYIGFYIYKSLKKQDVSDNQLRLFN